MNFVICFTGPPGSGKGTQSLRLYSKYEPLLSIGRVSIGDELRKMNKASSEGYLSSIDDIESIILNLIKLKKTINIIDGYPRSIEQMEQIYNLYSMDLVKQLVIFNLRINNSATLMNRLINRKNCPNCGYTSNVDHDIICSVCGTSMITRVDDKNTSAIEFRIQIYNDSFKQISSFCDDNNITLLNFDATKSIDQISFEIESAFRGILDIYLNNKVSARLK